MTPLRQLQNIYFWISGRCKVQQTMFTVLFKTLDRILENHYVITSSKINIKPLHNQSLCNKEIHIHTLNLFIHSFMHAFILLHYQFTPGPQDFLLSLHFSLPICYVPQPYPSPPYTNNHHILSLSIYLVMWRFSDQPLSLVTQLTSKKLICKWT